MKTNRPAAATDWRAHIAATIPWHQPSTLEQQARLTRDSGRPMFDLAEAIPRQAQRKGSLIPGDFTDYPDSRGISDLRALIAARENAKYGLSLTAEHIVITNGATEAISILVQAFTRPGDGVRVRSPGIFLYRDIIENHGARTLHFADRSFRGRTPLHIIHNPANPTGALLGSSAITLAMQRADAASSLLVLDQVYDELLYEGLRPHEDQGALEAGRLVKVNSVSKAFGAPGLRVGWIVANPGLALLLSGVAERLRISVSLASQLAAKDLLTQPLDPLVATMASRRQLVIDWLKTSTMFETTAPAAGLCYWLTIKHSALGATELCRRAFDEQGIRLMPGPSFWGGTDREIRMSFGSTPQVLTEGLSRLGRVCTALALQSTAPGRS